MLDLLKSIPFFFDSTFRIMEVTLFVTSLNFAVQISKNFKIVRLLVAIIVVSNNMIEQHCLAIILAIIILDDISSK